MKQLTNLLFHVSKIYEKSERSKEEKRTRGEFFNVFTTLGLWSEEVRLHSAMISELLNPYGNHGMGPAFLEQFLLMLGEKNNFLQANKIKHNIVERYIGPQTETEGGRIDIIIEDGQHAIIIENKINAKDQPNQLLRYYNYAQNKFPNNFRIIYLTLDGHLPNTTSIRDSKIPYITISYHKEIIQWLINCAKLAYDKPLIRETLKQYIYLLKQITNQDMENQDIKTIAELAIQNIEATTALINAIPEISNLLRETYIFQPLNQFALDNSMEITIAEGIRIRPKGWHHSISIMADAKGWKSLFIGIEPGDHSYVIHPKLDCLNQPSTEYWIYGWEWLPWREWESTSNYIEIKRGDVTHWIIEKIKEIIQEVSNKKIQL